MREIKFRVWHEELSKWIVGSIRNDGQLYSTELVPASFNTLRVLQYTGLRDKNGTEIYEGDILQWTDGDMWKGSVYWSEGDADFLLEDHHASLGGFETKPCLNGLDSIRCNGYSVIGNIFENPELLASD